MLQIVLLATVIIAFFITIQSSFASIILERLFTKMKWTVVHTPPPPLSFTLFRGAIFWMFVVALLTYNYPGKLFPDIDGLAYGLAETPKVPFLPKPAFVMTTSSTVVEDDEW